MKQLIIIILGSIVVIGLSVIWLNERMRRLHLYKKLKKAPGFMRTAYQILKQQGYRVIQMNLKLPVQYDIGRQS